MLVTALVINNYWFKALLNEGLFFYFHFKKIMSKRKSIKVLKIVKYNIAPDGLLELWIEGLGFTKSRKWNHEKQDFEPTEEDSWNLCCKPSQFIEWYYEDNSDNFDAILNKYGWDCILNTPCHFDKSRLHFILGLGYNQ